ncbi:MAG: hypothetical protein ACI97A_001136 [Planctomycetota bacterium]|jgi:hypothetical protein
MKIDVKSLVIVALLVAVGFLARGGTDSAFARFSGTDNNGDMIAVTGEYGNGTTVLWVIDTKSKQLAAYRSINGSTVELVGARRIEHDLKLITYRDRTPDAFMPLSLEKHYLDYRKGKVETSSPAGAAPEKEPTKKEK